jgi:mRNA degradation ribonuclease J1/J2
MHASGHLSQSELASAVRSISPKRVFPIHTEHPEAFRTFGPPVTEPSNGDVHPLP